MRRFLSICNHKGLACLLVLLGLSTVATASPSDEQITPVKPGPITYTVLGAVNKPGVYTSELPIGIEQILASAGGAKPRAELERVEVSGPAHPEKQLVNVEKHRDGDTSADYISQQDDVIVVRFGPRILLLGGVTHEGWIDICEGETLRSVLLRGGGVSEKYPKAQVIRPGRNGKPVRTTYNIREIIKKKKRDVRLLDEYIVYVPGKKRLVGCGAPVMAPMWMMRSVLSGR